MMNLKSILPLASSELQLIKRIAFYSCIGCVVIVGITWGVQRLLIWRNAAPTHNYVNTSAQFDSETILPVDIDAHLFAARFLRKQGHPEKAILHLQRLCGINKENMALHVELADAYLAAGYYQKALEKCERLPENVLPDTILEHTLSIKGAALYYLGEIKESYRILSSALSRFPNSVRSLCVLGQIESSQTPPSDSALLHLTKAIRLDSLYVEGRYQLARYLMKTKDYHGARKHLLRCITIDPLHAKSHSRLGMVYYYLREIFPAKNAYQTALALNPDDYNTWYNLGELHHSLLNDKKAAFRCYLSALEKKPDHIDANYKVGLICMENNMLKEAIRYFEQTMHNAPNEIPVLIQLAIAYEKIGIIDVSLEMYNKVLAIDPLNTVARQKMKLLAMEFNRE
jgi:tetratricopeptide (TPR) repeat protein